MSGPGERLSGGQYAKVQKERYSVSGAAGSQALVAVACLVSVKIHMLAVTLITYTDWETTAFCVEERLIDRARSWTRAFASRNEEEATVCFVRASAGAGLAARVLMAASDILSVKMVVELK